LSARPDLVFKKYKEKRSYDDSKNQALMAGDYFIEAKAS